MNGISVKALKYILKILAEFTLWRFQPKIIAVTGSAGKTSAKEAIFAVLRGERRVRKSSANFNNELGMPLTILGEWPEKELELVSLRQLAHTHKLRKFLFWVKVIFVSFFRLFTSKKSNYPEILILEYGADRPGDIYYLLSIGQLFIAVITTIGKIPVHVEYFSGPEALAQEKGKIIEALPASGYAVLNFDNEIVMKMKERTRGRVVSFGFKEGADLRINYFENVLEDQINGRIKPVGISFKLEYGGASVPVTIKNVFGRGQAYATAVAACVGLIFDLNLVEISEALSSNYSPAKGRLNLLEGIKNTLIIDDTYNASPLSVVEALEILKDLPASRKIAVLGDMLELGRYAVEAHEAIGKVVAQVADDLIVVGERAKFIAESAKKNGMMKNRIWSFDDVGEAGETLQKLMVKDDLVLIKASRSMNFEKIVEEVKER